MPPKKPKLRDDELFRMQLTNMIDMDHPLVKVAQLIDWSQFDEGFGQFYTQKGRPGLPTRLLAGLHLLKHMEGLSDQAVCKRWVENPYYQYFCGEQYFRHKLPLDRSSMTRWRGRIGPEKLELLLAQTLAVAMQTNAVTPQAFERVTLDTTVQTKAVAHPTDSILPAASRAARSIRSRWKRWKSTASRCVSPSCGRDAGRDAMCRVSSMVAATNRLCAGCAKCGPGWVAWIATLGEKSRATQRWKPLSPCRANGSPGF